MKKDSEDINAYLVGKLSCCMAQDEESGEMRFVMINEKDGEEMALAFNETQVLNLTNALGKAIQMFSEENDGYIIMD